jgi:hypothetical protein
LAFLTVHQVSRDLKFDGGGGLDTDYLIPDEFDDASIVWSPCGDGGLLSISTDMEVKALNPDDVAELTVSLPRCTL